MVGQAVVLPRGDSPLERLERLQRLTRALAGALTIADVADAVVSNVTVELRADAAMVCLLNRSGTRFKMIRQTGYPLETVRHWERFPLDASLPASDAVRNRQMVLLESVEDRDRRYPALRGAPAPHEAFTVLPLVAEERPLGIVSFAFKGPHDFGDGERQFLQSVIDQCAQAMHRAQLYEQQQRVAERQALVARAGQQLATSLSTVALAEELARLLVPAMGDVCLVHLNSRDGLYLGGIAHADRARAQELKGHAGDAHHGRDPRLLSAMSRGRPLLLSSLGDRRRQERNADRARLGLLELAGVDSVVIVPLVVRDRTVGTMTVGRLEGRRALDDDDVALLDEIGDYAALALHNAELFEERSRIATTLQMTLLPPALPTIPGLEVGASYLAAGHGSDVGGDFYDVFRADDDRWVVVLGDVCGRGVDAAATTGLVRHTVRAVGFGEVTPGEIMRRVNRALLDWLREHGDEPEPRFCALNIAVVEPSLSRVTVCCAGNPLPQIVSPDGSSIEIGCPGTVAGVLEDPDLGEVTAVLAPGDVLLTYTDGITERRHRHRMFEDVMPQVLPSLARRPAQECADLLRAAAVDFAADVPADDMAVLVLRVPEDAAE